MIKFILLGTGAGPGVPSFFCDCCACQEAQSKPECQRTRSGAVLKINDQNILIDTPPDLRVQLLKEKINSIDGIFLTHWHYDHFGGLGELEYYVKLKRKSPLSLYLPPSAINSFTAAFNNLLDVFSVKSWDFFQEYSFSDGSITPLPANHSIETAGFFIKSERIKLAYFPDTAGLPLISQQKIYGIDYFIGDATFSGENLLASSHMNMSQCKKTGEMIKAKHTVFTHMAMHYSHPVTVEQVEQRFGTSLVQVGYDGMSFVL